MTAASRPQAIRLRSGDVVLVRQVRPDDAPALARAYASLGDESRYRRFFTAIPEIPESVLTELTEIDHQDREVLVAVPLLSSEIVGGCQFVRHADHPDTAEVAATVVEAWQNRGVASALLARLSERALEAGIEYFTAEILAENRAVLAMLPRLGQVQTEAAGPVVSARIEIAEPPGPARPDLLDLLAAAARGQIMIIPAALRRLIRVPEELARMVRLPVTAVLTALPPLPPAPDPPVPAEETGTVDLLAGPHLRILLGTTRYQDQASSVLRSYASGLAASRRPRPPRHACQLCQAEGACYAAGNRPNLDNALRQPAASGAVPLANAGAGGRRARGPGAVRR